MEQCKFKKPISVDIHASGHSNIFVIRDVLCIIFEKSGVIKLYNSEGDICCVVPDGWLIKFNYID